MHWAVPIAVHTASTHECGTIEPPQPSQGMPGIRPAQEVFFGTALVGGGVEAGLVAAPGPLRALSRSSSCALSTMILCRRASKLHPKPSSSDLRRSGLLCVCQVQTIQSQCWLPGGPRVRDCRARNGCIPPGIKVHLQEPHLWGGKQRCQCRRPLMQTIE